jgi:hypothetical protein
LSRPQRQNPGKNAGKTSGQDSTIGRNLLAQFDPLSRDHPQQIGDTSDDIILEFIHSTAYQLPTSSERAGDDFRRSEAD